MKAMKSFSIFGLGFFCIVNSGFWDERKPWGIYKLTNWIDWRLDLKWISLTVWIEKL